MKKMMCVVLAMMLTLGLAACGSEPAETTLPGETPAGNQIQPAESQPEETLTGASETEPVNYGYQFAYGDLMIGMTMDAAPLVEALGEPMSYSEEQSCAFDGLHKTYYYGSFYLQTYPDGDKDRVYQVWMVDDSVTTQEGAYIGMTQTEVEAVYGTEGYNGSNAWQIEAGTCILTIILDNGVVTSIQYVANVL